MIEVKANGSNAGRAEGAAAPAINPANLAFAEELYAQFLQDPASVDPAWRAYFESLDNGVARPSAVAIRPPTNFARSIFAARAPSSNSNGAAVAAAPSKPPGRLQSERAQRLVEAYRELGHLSADLDPLGLVKRAGAPLDLEFYGLSSAELDQGFSSANVSELVIGMARRGRLNVLANILEKPAAQIFAEFMDKHGEESAGGGDVKYHLGHSQDRVFGSGPDAHRVHLSLSFNPSHLEWVNTVVQGRVRAKQDRLGDTERSRCLPLLIHGDAAFAGQGIVSEALNLSELD